MTIEIDNLYLLFKGGETRDQIFLWRHGVDGMPYIFQRDRSVAVAASGWIAGTKVAGFKNSLSQTGK